MTSVREEFQVLKAQIEDLLTAFTEETGVVVEAVDVDAKFNWLGQAIDESGKLKYRVRLEMSI